MLLNIFHDFKQFISNLLLISMKTIMNIQSVELLISHEFIKRTKQVLMKFREYIFMETGKCKFPGIFYSKVTSKLDYR